MNFFMMNETCSRPRAHPVFTVIKPHIGCARYVCDRCGIIGIKPARADLAIKVRCVDTVDDYEQVLSSHVASRRFQQLVQTAGLTGMEFYEPIQWAPEKPTQDLIDFTHRCADEYMVAWAYGRGGSIAHTSGVKLKRACDHCGWCEYTVPESVIIDADQWDGSDFFKIIELPGPVFMSDRAVDVLSNGDLSNFGFKRAEDHGFPKQSKNRH